MQIPLEYASELDSCKYLYLRNISQPRDNALHLLVEEATAGPESTTRAVAGALITDLHAIESTDESRLFELHWENYVAYSVQNESYSKTDDTETIASGKLVRIYSKLHFLDYDSTATIATPDYPGPLVHVQVVCLNHVVDIVSTQPPRIRLLRTRNVMKSN
jgi:hypothetical protein